MSILWLISWFVSLQVDFCTIPILDVEIEFLPEVNSAFIVEIVIPVEMDFFGMINAHDMTSLICQISF